MWSKTKGSGFAEEDNVGGDNTAAGCCGPTPPVIIKIENSLIILKAYAKG
jgi:hypothetical protein